jgi:hypothetical protein
MNKKVLYGIAALAIAALSVLNVNFNSQQSSLSDVSLANVEALAQELLAPSYNYTCYYGIIYGNDYLVHECNSCNFYSASVMAMPLHCSGW